MDYPWFLSKSGAGNHRYILANMPQCTDWEPIPSWEAPHFVRRFPNAEAHQIARDWLLRHGRSEEELDATVGVEWGPELCVVNTADETNETPRKSGLLIAILLFLCALMLSTAGILLT